MHIKFGASRLKALSFRAIRHLQCVSGSRRGAVDDLVGCTLGPNEQYVLLEQIGRGGMASVFAATQTALDRRVAIKVVDPALARQDGFNRRFEQEARIVARLEHPHILPVYDFGRTDGMFYLVMPL